MSDQKPTCGTCPHWHPHEPVPGEPILLSPVPMGECRGAPLQGRIIKGQWLTMYTPTPENAPACKEHPLYVPAREFPPPPYPLEGVGLVHYDVGRPVAACGATLSEFGPDCVSLLSGVTCPLCKAMGERL